MSGGEINGEEKEAYLHMRKIIEGQEDVHKLHELSWLPDEMRWLYMIQTPFATFPKFVIGHTGPENLDPVVVFQCSSEWGAQAEWDRQNHGNH